MSSSSSPHRVLHRPLPGRGLRIERQLARTRGSTVYELVDAVGRRYALKLVEGPDGSSARRRFEAELEALRRLDDPHVVPLLDAYVRPGPLYALLEPLLLGETLRERLRRRGRLGAAEARRWILDALRGLGAIHRAGLVHRDVCADNVVIGRAVDEGPGSERAIVVDLGLALPLGEGPTPGHVHAKLSSVSPEQILSGRLDARTDLYAVGALLYELLTGAPPFLEPTASATLAAHLEKLPPMPGATLGELAVFDGVVETALAKRPDRRYASAEEFGAALRALELGGHDQAPPRAEATRAAAMELHP